MKERPILFSAPMVRAILEGRKTQTRRVVKRNAAGRVQLSHRQWHIEDPEAVLACRYGQPSDRLWVKETYAIADGSGRLIDPCINYRADGTVLPLIGHADPHTWSLACNRNEVNDVDLLEVPDGWRPSIFMYRWASRLLLENSEIRIQRLQDIEERDAIAEGAEPWSFGTEQTLTSGERGCLSPYRSGYAVLWDEINADRGFTWKSNPWVWAVTFRQVKP